MLGQAKKAQVVAKKQCENERLEKEKQIKGRAKEKEKVAQLGDRLASCRRQRKGLAHKLKAAAVQYNKLDKEATVSICASSTFSLMNLFPPHSGFIAGSCSKCSSK